MSRKTGKGLRKAVKALIREETRCLDEGDLAAWSALFTEDGYYWMPLEPTQTSPAEHDSLIYDNRALMEMRRLNLANPLAPSLQCAPRSARILSALDLGPEEPAGELTVKARVIAVIRHQRQDCFAGAVTWRLIQTEAGLRIKSKRVDLLNADLPLDSIMMYV